MPDRLSDSRESSVGPTLRLAREMRASGDVQPSRLYESALRESREHYVVTPAVITQMTRDLYNHAMHEAGAIVSKGTGRPLGKCPVCGWEASGA